MQFCHMVTYDRVMRTIFLTIQVFSFEIRNLTYTACRCRHNDLQIFFFCSFLESTKSVATAYCIFEQFLNTEKIVVVLQPSAAAQRYAGSTHTDSGNCWYMPAPISDHPDRPDPEPPGNRTHAGVYPPVGNFWCASMHCSSEPRSCRSGTVRSSAGH